MKTALITGVSGQDGAYLAKLLLSKGYKVWGTSRDAQMASFRNLERLKVREDLRLASVALSDFRSVIQVLFKAQPDEIYNLAGQSSVGLSFEQPVETQDSIYLGTLNLLEAIRFTGKQIRLYNASSSECFGDLRNDAATEDSPFRPRSPYAVAKAAAFWQVSNYREAYKIFACSGILFNHESPLRPERFVTKKIVSAARKIARGEQQELRLGNIDVYRDWGWAPEYVQAMYLMLQQEKPDDYVIATGTSRPLRDFVEAAFRHLGLDWEKYTVIDKSLFRPTDLNIGRADASKAAEQLGWQASYQMDDVARLMVEAEGG
jgi:GDPmannose 4,6-dehydratase